MKQFLLLLVLSLYLLTVELKGPNKQLNFKKNRQAGMCQILVNRNYVSRFVVKTNFEFLHLSSTKALWSWGLVDGY